ncbi:hypothetical protein O181_001001 [Austropuccinia psidii MF-1]|uniref:Uncharacterized protein n=1 Tax=Austropuccinia psidii MF-1 TaxID=1389203 RepID=A0A9Q3BA53_9BASI|nr:hypothetical protein [Austropuccinia psidii MF-1]
MERKHRSPLQYQDGDNLTYSEKEALKKLSEAPSWPNISVVGEYDHMELIEYIDGLFIDLPSIPDYWIEARLNISFKGHAIIFYTEMKEIHCGRVKKSKSKVMPFSVYNKDKHRDTVAEVLPKKNSWHNCGSTDYNSNSFQKSKKKIYAIEQVPGDNIQTEESHSDSIGDAIRENSYYYQDPIEEHLVEYQA